MPETEVGCQVLVLQAPFDEEGTAVDAFQVAPLTRIAGTPVDHWILTLGLVTPQGFEPRWAESLQDGLAGPVVRFILGSPVRVPRGGLLALQASTRGLPAALPHLSILVEYRILRREA
jgi:hypothetical protein